MLDNKCTFCGKWCKDILIHLDIHIKDSNNVAATFKNGHYEMMLMHDYFEYTIYGTCAMIRKFLYIQVPGYFWYMKHCPDGFPKYKTFIKRINTYKKLYEDMMFCREKDFTHKMNHLITDDFLITIALLAFRVSPVCLDVFIRLVGPLLQENSIFTSK